MKGYVLEKIWDPVTRLWHWVLAALVITGWLLGEFMDFDTIMWHFYIGYTVLGLVVFRLVWGLLGPAPVRLSALVPRPSAIMAYLRHMGSREPSGTPGHNPLGALSVLALLLVVGGQAFTGLFIVSDDFFESGPLASYVSEDWNSRMSGFHHDLSEILLILVALHVAAVFFYLIWKRENLIRPMITGMKWVKRSRGGD